MKDAHFVSENLGWELSFNMVGHQQLQRGLEQRVPGGGMATLLGREGEHHWL